MHDTSEQDSEYGALIVTDCEAGMTNDRECLEVPLFLSPKKRIYEMMLSKVDKFKAKTGENAVPRLSYRTVKCQVKPTQHVSMLDDIRIL